MLFQSIILIFISEIEPFASIRKLVGMELSRNIAYSEPLLVLAWLACWWYPGLQVINQYIPISYSIFNINHHRWINSLGFNLYSHADIVVILSLG